MKEINISRNKINYNQRNNIVNPYKSCNTTSMVMAISYINPLWQLLKQSPIYIQYHQKYKQPEDCLQQYMLDQGLKPTIHADLSKATNQFVGKKITQFKTNLKKSFLIEQLNKGYPVVISGNFPKGKSGILSHIVVLVGVVLNEYDVPIEWIIDDPYGNTLNNWEGSGNDIHITDQYFNDYIKNCSSSSKWGHYFIV